MCLCSLFMFLVFLSPAHTHCTKGMTSMMPKLDQPAGIPPRGPPPINTPKFTASTTPSQVPNPAVTTQPIGFSPVNSQYTGSGNISVTSQTTQITAGAFRRNEGLPGTTTSTFGGPPSVGTSQPFGPAVGEGRERMFNPAATSGTAPIGTGVPPPTVVSSMLFNRGTPPVLQRGVAHEGGPTVGERGDQSLTGMLSTNRPPVPISMSGPPRVSWNGDVHMFVYVYIV